MNLPPMRVLEQFLVCLLSVGHCLVSLIKVLFFLNTIILAITLPCHLV